MLRKLLSGVAAGVCISLGGSVFLACENKIVGSVFFCVALLCICYKGYALFTGKVGFIPEKHGKEELSVLFLGLLGNLIGTVLCGLLVSVALPNLSETAANICNTKLDQPILSTLIRGFFCGVLMYLAVSIFRDKQKSIGILFCIPVFILSGFEHSIADMFYFACGKVFTCNSLLFILLVVLGNAVGGMLLPIITMKKGE